MENELFDWDGWDELDVRHLQFYGCELKQAIHPVKVGAVVPCITINFDTGDLQMLKDNGTIIAEHKVRLVLNTPEG